MADQGKSRQEIWASEATLTLLGPLRLVGLTGNDLTPKARKTRAVLAIAALSKGAVPRGRLIDLLWGDRGEEQARASLRQALYELRDLTTAGLLTATREAVAAGPKRLSTDVAKLEALTDPPDISDALAEVQWPPLPDLDDLTPELDDWLRGERSRISMLLLQRGVDAGERALDCADPAPARRIADTLERIDPLDERAVQLGARADVSAGDRAAAYRRVERFEARLRDELGLQPSPDTRALLSRTPVAQSKPGGILGASRPGLALAG